jgi:hypothetical protein
MNQSFEQHDSFQPKDPEHDRDLSSDKPEASAREALPNICFKPSKEGLSIARGFRPEGGE